MKKFKDERLFLKVNPPTIFTEEFPPDWLKHKINHVWYQDHVLKLKVGRSICSEFNKITRLE